LLFANWLKENGKIREHDLDRLPLANRHADPVRPRRALTPDEFARLLDVARSRPVADARTARRGTRKGQQIAELRPDVVEALDQLGRERVFIMTGLRLGELRTLKVGSLDLSPGNESLRLEVRNEKNGAGSTLPIRSDLAAELRLWIREQKLSPTDLLFRVPAGLRRILDRDLKAAGIPKRDERGRTIDVHALRTTFGTWLSVCGVAPRTAQAAMRHSDIKLTMTIYCDPAQLGIREALDALPSVTLEKIRYQNRDLENDPRGQNGAITVNQEHLSKCGSETVEAHEMPGNVNEKTPVTTGVITGGEVGLTGFEPATSWSRTKRSTKLSYSPMKRLCSNS
jgi:integrase